jgi:peptidoglycan/xylan/chitin deacetylase (PgdA/CDA1 family)
MRHIAVNFHYVGMPSMPHPGIHGLGGEEFAACLERLGRDFEFVSLQSLLAAERAGRFGNDSAKCLVTFDDGLRCQYEMALPILDRMGIPAAFFVLGGPYLHGKAATVHKLHFARASLGDVAMMGLVDALCAERGIRESPAGLDIAAVRDSYRYDDETSARMKYFLNYLMPEDFVEAAVERAFSAIGISETDFIRESYMTPAMIADLAKRGLVGSHAVSHRPLAKMGMAQARAELSESKAWIERVSGTSIDAVSYPLGNKDAVSRQIADEARAAGYRLGYSMERAQNASFLDPLLYARFDASDAARLGRDADLPRRARYMQE